MNKVSTRVLIIVSTALVIMGFGFYVWTQFDYDAEPSALNDMLTTESVTVLNGKNIVFFPKGEVKPLGVVFYPGGKVAPEAYAPLMMKMAEQGYEVIVVRMPLNLAVFDSDAVKKIVDERSDKEWVLAGHSLGGAMAASYLSKRPESEIKGLLLWGAYTDEGHSMKESPIPVASVYGTKDMGIESLEAMKIYLPDSTDYYVIEGGNHAQFGEYGTQKGDFEADISPEDQQNQVVAYSVDFLDKLVEKLTSK